MNFFAHMLLLGADPPPEAVLGSILPDVAKKSGLILNQSWLRAHKATLHPDLAFGIHTHLSGDQLFHDSQLFHWLTGLWHLPLNQSTFPIKYTFFLKHLVAEMWLDRVLLSQQAQQLHTYYQQLSSLDDSLPELTRAGMASDVAHTSLLNWIRRFYQEQFLFAYLKPHEFAETAARVFTNVTQQTSKKQEVQEMVSKQLFPLQKANTEVFDRWTDFHKTFMDT